MSTALNKGKGRSGGLGTPRHDDNPVHFYTGKPIPLRAVKSMQGKNGAVKVIKKATKDKHGNPLQSTTE